MAAVALQADVAAAPPPAQQDGRLRRACNEFIGMVMFGQIMRQVRDSSLNSELMHSSGERIFQRQLDDVLLQRACAADSAGGMFGQLGEAMYRSLSASRAAGGHQSVLNVKG